MFNSSKNCYYIQTQDHFKANHIIGSGDYTKIFRKNIERF